MLENKGEILLLWSLIPGLDCEYGAIALHRRTRDRGSAASHSLSPAQHGWRRKRHGRRTRSRRGSCTRSGGFRTSCSGNACRPVCRCPSRVAILRSCSILWPRNILRPRSDQRKTVPVSQPAPVWLWPRMLWRISLPQPVFHWRGFRLRRSFWFRGTFWRLLSFVRLLSV